MENIIYILPRGLAIGALISAPMGPIGMLIIQRTLSKGRWPAFFTGIGAALSDLLYCLLAGFGLSFITDVIERHQFALQVFGSIVLAAFGLFLFRKNPTRSLKTAEVDGRSYWGDFISGFFLTVSNPLILFFIIGLFARFNFIMPEYEIFHYIWAYLTIFGGAMIWWYIVTLLVNKLRSRFNVRSLWLVNRIVATILIAMAVIGVALAINEHMLS
ncbi:MAG: LysE family translocator [Muribaculaceae bacterium]|nr:LysE family translocator [Muribaculaceae bacterium]MDE5594604.1 LysE family translocator [Muribaculaceae bacterium]MDE6702469.1 LysE family translocator [Muribaculaceae bacterium]